MAEVFTFDNIVKVSDLIELHADGLRSLGGLFDNSTIGVESVCTFIFQTVDISDRFTAAIGLSPEI